MKPPVIVCPMISPAMNCKAKIAMPVPGSRLSNVRHRQKRTATAPHPKDLVAGYALAHPTWPRY
jgi:hypothetical protein